MQEKYVLKRLLGQGGMSRVYLAFDTKLHKKWAVKEIDCLGEGKEHFIKVLRAETNVLKRLDHKYLPRVVDIYEKQEKVYLVMDYIEGDSLQEILQKYGSQKPEKIVQWGIQIADALCYLHSRRPAILYRDLKPSNIILRQDGTICLVDFGTAVICGTTGMEPFGTRGFAAPEQYRNEADERSDIYAFGKTMLCLLKGTQQNLLLHGLTRILVRCVQEKPEKRYQSVRELLSALRRYRRRQELFRKRTQLFLVLWVISLLMGITGYGLITSRQHHQEEQWKQEYRCAIEAGNDALLLGDESTAAKSFERAITQIDATNPEGYLCLLRLYVRRGEAKEGLLRLKGYLDSDYGGISEREELLFEMGRVSFYECRDYPGALSYFTQIPEREEAAYYQSLCRCLSEIHLDSGFLSKTLQEFYSYNQHQSDASKKIQNNISIARVYLTYGEELKEGLQRARQIMMEKENRASEEESLRMLTTIYRLLGKRDSKNRTYYYRQSLRYTRQLLAVPGVREEGSLYRVKLCDMATMYEELGQERAALHCYEMSEKQYPGEGKDIYLHHLLLLLRQHESDTSVMKLYQEAKQVKGMQEDSQFQKLEQRIQELYGQKGEQVYE